MKHQLCFLIEYDYQFDLNSNFKQCSVVADDDSSKIPNLLILTVLSPHSSSDPWQLHTAENVNHSLGNSDIEVDSSVRI